MTSTERTMVLGVFENAEQARAAVQTLQDAGFDTEDISLALPGSGVYAWPGIPEAEARWYEEQVRQGSAVVKVHAEARYEQAREILRRAGAHGVDGGQDQAAAPWPEEGRQTMELLEEEVVVRKEPRQVGEVEIRREVVTETRTIEVPVAREELVVTTTGNVRIRGVTPQGSLSSGPAGAMLETTRGWSRWLPGAVLGVLAAVGPALAALRLYRRRQRERNRPLYRVRRQVRRVASQMGDRLPATGDLVQYLPERRVAGPAGGLGAGLLLLGLLVTRAVRRRASSGQRVDQVPQDLVEMPPTRLARRVGEVSARWLDGRLPTADAAHVSRRSPPARFLVAIAATVGMVFLGRRLLGREGREPRLAQP